MHTRLVESAPELWSGDFPPPPRPRAPALEQETGMTRVLVLYYSSYGHVETLARAVAAGRIRCGRHLKRVPETAPAEVAKGFGFKLDQEAPIAKVEDLKGYGRHHRRLPHALRPHVLPQMATFWDQAGGLWMNGALNGKVGGAFTSTATQHGGQEMTLFSILVNLLHFGFTIIGLPYSHQGQTTLDEIVGGSPYGATTIAGAQGQRQPSAIELDGARHQGELIAKAAIKLSA